MFFDLIHKIVLNKLAELIVLLENVVIARGRYFEAVAETCSGNVQSKFARNDHVGCTLCRLNLFALGIVIVKWLDWSWSVRKTNRILIRNILADFTRNKPWHQQVRPECNSICGVDHSHAASEHTCHRGNFWVR